MPGGGRIDVSVETMMMVLNRRSDIRDLYCANLRPNGVPWCPVVNGQPQPDALGIITDWWTRNAGASDDPSLYGFSLAKFVEQQFGIPVVAQPGDKATGVSASKSISSVLSGESVPASYVISGIVAFTSLMFLWGSTRKQKLIYQETGGVGAAPGRGRRR